MDKSKVGLFASGCLLFFFALPANAAKISGFVKTAANTPAQNAQVIFKCPKRNPLTVTTDKYGRYRANGLPDVKWCELHIVFGNITTLPSKVNSGKGSKDINFKLVNVNGTWKLLF